MQHGCGAKSQIAPGVKAEQRRDRSQFLSSSHAFNHPSMQKPVFRLDRIVSAFVLHSFLPFLLSAALSLSVDHVYNIIMALFRSCSLLFLPFTGPIACPQFPVLFRTRRVYTL